jgi:hypothetical protein
VYWSARRAEGALMFDAGVEAGLDGCHHGNREPDCGAGAGAAAGAGAKHPEDETAAERFARHCARNCGQLSPPIVPAALASFHWLAHVFMTPWPAEGPPRFRPRRKQRSTAATMVTGSLTEGQARERPSPGMARRLSVGERGTAPETVANSDHQSFPRPTPASIRLRMFS